MIAVGTQCTDANAAAVHELRPEPGSAFFEQLRPGWRVAHRPRGHGPRDRSVGGSDQVQARIDQDRAYVHALRDAQQSRKQVH